MPVVVRFTAPRRVDLHTYDDRNLVATEVRVRTLFSGISAGTELTAYRGSNPYLAKRWDEDARLFVPDAASLEYPVEGWGYEVVIAASEGEAVERLSELDRAPDIIITDYRLRAGRTGIEAIRHIRARYGNRPIPSLLITGDTAPERLQEAEASGYRLLHKPVSSSKLKDVLEAYRTL